jgi:phosphate butyryltransferase
VNNFLDLINPGQGIELKMEDKMIKNFDELLDRVVALPSKHVVIPGADTESAVEAAIMVHKKNIADFLLIGDVKKIKQLISEIDESMIDQFEYIDEKDDVLCVEKGIKAIKEGRAEVILKGRTATSTLMKGILDKSAGLNTGGVMSDVFVYETDKKLIMMSDGGIVINPGVKEKTAMVKNAVRVAHALGYQLPKVALLAAVEVVNPKMQATLDAVEVVELNRKGEIKGCIVDGPFALDMAISREAALIKGVDSPVAGDADILIMPNIESGNVFGKSITYYGKMRVAHLLMGCKVPVLITSRADDANTKLLSIALGNICA